MTARCEMLVISLMLLAAGGTIASEPHSTGNRSDAMDVSRYSTVIALLKNAAIPVRELKGPGGRVAVTLAAGRIVAMAFTEDGPDLLWANPQLSDAAIGRAEELVGGMGGDRLWLSPELDYFWHGVPDWKQFSNYRTPVDIDPGRYEFVHTGGKSIDLRGKGALTASSANQQSLSFELTRTLRMAPPPISSGDPLMREINYIGVESSHILKVNDSTASARVDLWHLLQVPVGSVLIVPLNPKASDRERQPLSYGLPGSWKVHENYLLWKYGGDAHAKFGLSAVALTGRSAVVRRLDTGDWCLIVRQFSADPKATYGDHPYAIARNDQVFQAWDGYGFGEMEYHSPVIGGATQSQELEEQDQLWAFGGNEAAIVRLGSRLLGVDIAPAVGRD